MQPISGYFARLRGAPLLSGLVRAFAVSVFAAVAVLGTAIEGHPGESLFCTCLMIALALLGIALTRRIAFSLLVVAALVLALRGISMIKIRYLGAPLFAPDLLYFSNLDTLHVVGEYPKIWHGVLKRTLLGVALLWLCWRVERPLWQARARSWRWGARFATAAAAVALYVVALLPQGPFANVLAKGIWEAINPGSPLTSFVLSLHRMQLEIPTFEGSAADAREWVDPAADKAATRAALPDIVVVLEESTFDPRTLAVCDRPECDVPMFQQDEHTRAHGALRVHTYGGGTWTSEFTFLSGLPNDMFGSGGFYAPFNLAPRINATLPKLLKTQGYRTIALYPMPGNFVNAQRAYTYYGFDVFHDSSEYELAWESPDSVIEQQFEKLYREERERSDQPLFFMVLTMRQHGPHTDPYERLHAPYDRPLFAALDENRNLNMANYLERLHGSDAAIERLQRVLFEGRRPAVLAHFGDHQPSFDGLLADMPLTADATRLGDPHHLTYYMLRTNDRAPAAAHEYAVLDLGFLAGLILDAAGIHKDAFFEANTRLREHCGGRYLDCPDQAALNSYEAFVFDRLHVIGG